MDLALEMTEAGLGHKAVELGTAETGLASEFIIFIAPRQKVLCGQQ